MTSPLVLRWSGANRLEWFFYDRDGRFVREVAEEEVPALRLDPVTHVHVNGGYLMPDPGVGFYVARWATEAA